ncbi:MAG: hypothetical protein ACI4DU_01390 [Lachnospiraceae bacterium]
MKRTNYYAIVRDNGSIDEVFSSRNEAELYYREMYMDGIVDDDYKRCGAEIIRGIDNIINYAETKGVHWTKQEIKDLFEGNI